ncbi:MAG: uracil-DNA glycosylase [Nitrospiraceae bacterium]|nr:MAG: uracil-DNA glycosylase [Nitrospiraceae bacterium]
MDNREVTEELIKALEVYEELGFTFLPLKRDRIFNLMQSRPVYAVAESREGTISEPDHIMSRDNARALQELREELGECTRCKLHKERKNIVYGEGSSDARLMFIGEGPGRDEDMQARPFVGEAGKLLTRLIEKMGMKRENVYIANIVKCRPPYNRDPEENEIAACKPFVERQIEIIKPKVIMSLGRVSAQSILGMKMPISRMRGNFFSFHDIALMPTFHPAYLLRNPKDKWLVWDDAQKVLEKLKD